VNVIYGEHCSSSVLTIWLLMLRVDTAAVVVNC